MVPSFWKVPVKFLIVLAVPPSASSLPAMLKLLPARPSMVVCCSSSSEAVPAGSVDLDDAAGGADVVVEVVVEQGERGAGAAHLHGAVVLEGAGEILDRARRAAVGQQLAGDAEAAAGQAVNGGVLQLQLRGSPAGSVDLDDAAGRADVVVEVVVEQGERGAGDAHLDGAVVLEGAGEILDRARRAAVGQQLAGDAEAAGGEDC